jgi:hypothetical protein
MTKSEIEKILKNISMAPTCLDMGWKWKVRELGEFGYTFCVSFQRPDTITGEIGTGYGREWFVPKDSSEKFIVMTAWLSIDLILKHEAMEAFHYNNERILDPHKSLSELGYPNHKTSKDFLKETKIE